MRLVMMGTGPFAVPTFRALMDSHHEVVGLVTRPPRVSQGRRKAPPNPMADEAKNRGLPTLAPPSVNQPSARRTLSDWKPDLLVVCDYGEILTPETLTLAEWGGINLHASLLPKYRGAAPINWAIYHGESATGNTVIQMTPGLDAGPCLAQCSTPIDPEETALELEIRLAQMGASLVYQAIKLLASGESQPLPQDPHLASKAPRLKKTDGLVDWSQRAQQIKNQVRAMQPWPMAYTFSEQPGREPLRLILYKVSLVEAESVESTSGGTVLEADRRFLIASGEGTLEVIRVQPAGRRVLSASEFLRGCKLRAGQKLGNYGQS